MKKLFVISLLLLSASCAQNPAYAPKYAKIAPNDWKELSCSGFLTWNDCRQSARAICPQGFYTADALENYLIQRRVVSVACKG